MSKMIQFLATLSRINILEQRLRIIKNIPIPVAVIISANLMTGLS